MAFKQGSFESASKNNAQIRDSESGQAGGFRQFIFREIQAEKIASEIFFKFEFLAHVFFKSKPCALEKNNRSRFISRCYSMECAIMPVAGTTPQLIIKIPICKWLLNNRKLKNNNNFDAMSVPSYTSPSPPQILQLTSFFELLCSPAASRHSGHDVSLTFAPNI